MLFSNDLEKKFNCNNLFYAINPALSPIISKLSLISVYLDEKNNLVRKIMIQNDVWNNSWRKYPDPELKNKESLKVLYFYTWTKEIFNTIPLYIYRTSKNTELMVFEKINFLKQLPISPLYVIDPKIYDYNIDSIKFTCYNNIITPFYNKFENNVFLKSDPIKPTNLTNAILLCTQISNSENDSYLPGSIQDILDDLGNKNKQNYNNMDQKKETNNSNNIVNIFALLIFITYTFILIILITFVFK
tara:strand:- start:5034 stop:5768 length:735 start_codon:yes stop_codon:yes gene_type:complete